MCPIPFTPDIPTVNIIELQNKELRTSAFSFQIWTKRWLVCVTTKMLISLPDEFLGCVVTQQDEFVQTTSKSIVLYLDHGLISSTISYPPLACRGQNLMSRDFQKCHLLDLCDFLTCLHIGFWNYHLDVRLYYVMDNIRENKTGAIWIANSYSFISTKINLIHVLIE